MQNAHFSEIRIRFARIGSNKWPDLTTTLCFSVRHQPDPRVHVRDRDRDVLLRSLRASRIRVAEAAQVLPKILPQRVRSNIFSSRALTSLGKPSLKRS